MPEGVTTLIRASIKELEEEVAAIAKEKGFPLSFDEKDFLIKRILKEFEELKAANDKGEAPERIAEEAIDVLIQSTQLIIALGLSPNEIYNAKMEKNWKRNWNRQNNGDFLAS